MGRTHRKKLEAREARLTALPTSERLLKSALIKKKESRVLSATEKHALKMSSKQGDILRLWEKLRTLEDDAKTSTEAPSGGTKDRKTAYEHKYPIVEKLLHLTERDFASGMRTPNISRVVQSMIKYGSTEQVGKIAKWVSKDLAAYSTDSYAHFVVNALIRHASHDIFDLLLTRFIPIVPQLISNKFGINVLHFVYSSHWCKSDDRDLILLAVFRDNTAVMRQWNGYPVLEDIIRRNPHLQKRLLTRLFDLGDKLVSHKGAVGYPFVQRLIHAFMCYGTRDEVSELCATLRPHLATVALTREGAPLASLAFGLTDPPKRKEILRSFADNLSELSTGKYSAPVIARLFDLLYDAQLLHKYILKELRQNIRMLIDSPYGYLIIIHLLTPHQDRKDRLLLPNWSQHNLFSIENTEWNHHTWLTSNYTEEVIEFCSKPAMNSHLLSLPAIVESFLMVLAEEDLAAPKLNRLHTGIIARELLTVIEHEPLYKSSLHLSKEQLALLNKVIPASGKRHSREDHEQDPQGEPSVRPSLKRPHAEDLRNTSVVVEEKASRQKRVRKKMQKKAHENLLTTKKTKVKS
ncbi:unnamed protein product [Phytomonas sp. EM1]|nr:unnamed protein product [Phytomonas sp. EM1]|eukprot:CCW64300.1 unnamed protein product [Phytomonas sp. isolate EM1]